MTREQAKKMLITLGIEEPTEEQVTNYLNSVNGEVQKEKTRADAQKEELQRLKKVEKELEEEKNKNLTAEEKLQAELEKAKKLQRDFAIKTNKLEVEKIFVGAGLTEEDYKDFIDDVVSEDSEISSKLANGLVGTINKQKEIAVQKTKEELLDETPTPENGEGGDGSSDEKTEAEKLAETIGKAAGKETETTENVLNNYL